MTTATTNGIQISVESRYEYRLSKPDDNLFMFSYHIVIENTNMFSIKLLRRHWLISDSAMQHREVKGEGVVGDRPVIGPDETYAYHSACDFSTDTGRMTGTYIMRNLKTGEIFEVDIPEMMLMVPHKLN